MGLNIVDINVFYSTFTDEYFFLFFFCVTFYVFNVFYMMFSNVFASTRNSVRLTSVSAFLVFDNLCHDTCR